MKMSNHMTWFLNEQYRGAELLCDVCNIKLDWMDKWYYRSFIEDEYASMCICGDCAKRMSEQNGQKE